MTNNDIDIDILLIEDSPDDAEITLRSLRKRNIANSVAWVKDGAAALEFIFGTAPAPGLRCPKVILLDLRLPKVDGIEVLQRLKSDQRTRQIPVVALSSSTQDQDIQRCYELGVNSYVSKPVEFEDFAEAVAKLGLYWLMINRPPERA